MVQWIVKLQCRWYALRLRIALRVSSFLLFGCLLIFVRFMRGVIDVLRDGVERYRGGCMIKRSMGKGETSSRMYEVASESSAVSCC